LGSNLETEKQRRTVAKLLAKARMHQKQIVLTNFRDNQGVSGLDIASVISFVGTD
jgi:hypothetical protein